MQEITHTLSYIELDSFGGNQEALVQYLRERGMDIRYEPSIKGIIANHGSFFSWKDFNGKREFIWRNTSGNIYIDQTNSTSSSTSHSVNFTGGIDWPGSNYFYPQHLRTPPVVEKQETKPIEKKKKSYEEPTRQVTPED